MLAFVDWLHLYSTLILVQLNLSIQTEGETLLKSKELNIKIEIELEKAKKVCEVMLIKNNIRETFLKVKTIDCFVVH